MRVEWTDKAVEDVERLYLFLESRNPAAAARVVQRLVAIPGRLQTHPRLGEQLFQFEPNEVRRWLVGDYEIRYEIRGDAVYVLHLWHTREDRP